MIDLTVVLFIRFLFCFSVVVVVVVVVEFHILTIKFAAECGSPEPLECMRGQRGLCQTIVDSSFPQEFPYLICEWQSAAECDKNSERSFGKMWPRPERLHTQQRTAVNLRPCLEAREMGKIASH